ncbi:Metallo-dependent phosphatase [Anaeromyces robustus]|uniref:Purple acid phosphatase n=1 Tax=Anaeromyces robustus TaxID=1754192 RepID=A0A1Y1XJT9_9FUNG|nr:Metallo-dependent phosphatase [Anaeromyces robustus]|eukprot:ORX86010.1 Metallo-dependent phosphatase [Anaeromyces robustus]
MKTITFLFPLLLLASVKAEQYEDFCWASIIYGVYDCCPKNQPVYEENSLGKWGKINGNYCGIKTSIEDKEYFNRYPKEYFEYPQFKVRNVKVPDDYCWSKYVKTKSTGGNLKCCKSDDVPIYRFEMDGIIGYENNTFCGLKGFQTFWNDREKFVDTYDKYQAFKKKWDNEYRDNFERISVFPGEDESMLNFGWYSKTKTEPAIRVSKYKNMKPYVDFVGKIEFYREIGGQSYYSNKVTISGLERSSTYYYQRRLNNKWESAIKFNTYDPDNFKFIFVGDPQIGGSEGHVTYDNPTEPLSEVDGTKNDAFNWNMTIHKSLELTKEPSLLLSAGDQVNAFCMEGYDKQYELQEYEYSALLLPDPLKSLPMATTVGNHEIYTKAFKNHYHTPNSYETPLEPDLAPGYNYFFKYNNVLVIVLETNYGYCDDFKEVMRRAHLKYPNTDWRIVMFHHDIYSNGKFHSQESYITDTLRPCLSQLMTYYKIDLVINGHDHIYSASRLITYDKNEDLGFKSVQLTPGKTNKNVKGTYYVTANCSTGSKLFSFIEESKDYTNNFNQTYTSTFGVIDFEKDKKSHTVQMTVNYYEVDTLRQIDGPYIFSKSEKCWSERLGYPCCTTTKKAYTEDSDGKWGVEKGNYCGIIEEDIPFNTKPISSNIKLPKSCNAYEEGYPCCFKGDEGVASTSSQGWGSMKGSYWCKLISKDAETRPVPIVPPDYDPTIIKSTVTIPSLDDDTDNTNSKTNPSKPEPTNTDDCWSIPLGYPCCSNSYLPTLFTDDNGEWSVENDNWCGKIVSETPKENTCWSIQYGYECCKDPETPVYSKDSTGEWGIENNNWCGIVKNNNNNNNKKTTTTTKKASTTTKKASTTTTKKASTTTKKASTTTKKTITSTKKTTIKTTTTVVKTPESTGKCIEAWGQCGGTVNGKKYNGSTCCVSGYKCKEYNTNYAQCVPDN